MALWKKRLVERPITEVETLGMNISKSIKNKKISHGKSKLGESKNSFDPYEKWFWLYYSFEKWLHIYIHQKMNQKVKRELFSPKL